MKFTKTQIAVFMLMATASLLAYYLTPTKKISDTGPKVNLEEMIPISFNGWVIDTSITPILPDKARQNVINRIYNQTLTRTYVKNGNNMMLSIAYGGDQSDGMQVHKPEVCYPAQGFNVNKITRGAVHINVNNQTIQVKTLVASLSNRIEPITYWTTIGNQIALGSYEAKLAQIKYGLNGAIPDGLLFRVSSIQPDEQQAFKAQAEFINDLMSNIKRQDLVRLIGTPSTNKIIN